MGQNRHCLDEPTVIAMRELPPEVREKILYFRRLSVIAADEGDEWRSDAHWEYADKLKRDAMEALDDE